MNIRTFLIYFTLIIICPGVSYASKKILTFGDSLTSGHGINPEKGWVNLLSEKLNQHHYNYIIINDSISGDTTKTGLARLQQSIRLYNPDIVILALGSNDGLRGIPAKQIEANLDKIITLLIDKNIKILLVGFKLPTNYGPVYRNQFEDIYDKLANKYELTYLPFLLEGAALERNYFTKDSIHPNETAQPIILNNVWHYLKPML